jgi:hypothetical protein
MLIHRHGPADCRVAYAAWRAFDSPLRGGEVPSTCGLHGPPVATEVVRPPEIHELWWIVEAEDAASALTQVPPFVRERTEVREVTHVKVG